MGNLDYSMVLLDNILEWQNPLPWFFAMLQKYLSQCDTYFKFAESKNKFYFYSFIDTLYIGSDVVKMVFYLFFPEFCLFLRDLPHSLMQKKKSRVSNKSVGKKRVVLVTIRESCLFITWSCCILTISGKNNTSNINWRPSPAWRVGIALLCLLFLCSDLYERHCLHKKTHNNNFLLTFCVPHFHKNWLVLCKDILLYLIYWSKLEMLASSAWSYGSHVQGNRIQPLMWAPGQKCFTYAVHYQPRIWTLFMLLSL